MKESFWGAMILTLGVISIMFIYLFQNITNTDQNNYTMLKEITEAAMYDSIDELTYVNEGKVKINREKFIENFVRRFAEEASLSNSYKITIYSISEYPPKVSLKVSSTQSGSVNNQIIDFNIDNRIDSILEIPY